MKRLNLKCLLIAGVALMAAIVFAETPNLRVGIVSDTQSYPGRDTWGQKNLRDALTFLKNKNIDVLLYAGDIANDGHFVVYR